VDQGKHGIVYIAAWPEQWLQDWADDTPRYHGHWESGTDPAQMLEDGPGWDDPEEAIRWGRERASLVSIRIGETIYSAGDEDFEDEVVPRWESRPT
jgi:hypothetical protein